MADQLKQNALNLGIGVMLIQSSLWIFASLMQVWTFLSQFSPIYKKNHSHPHLSHDHSRCANFVILLVCFGFWFFLNILLLTTSRDVLARPWALNLVGLPPLIVALLAVALTSLGIYTYDDHNELVFEAIFEFGSGVALLFLMGYCLTYANYGLAKDSVPIHRTIKRWLLINGLILMVYTGLCFALHLNNEKYLASFAVVLYLYGYTQLQVGGPPVWMAPPHQD